jgi:hypothetical protein
MICFKGTNGCGGMVLTIPGSNNGIIIHRVSKPFGPALLLVDCEKDRIVCHVVGFRAEPRYQANPSIRALCLSA